MNDAQTWTIIGGTLGLMVAGITWIQASLGAHLRTIDARFDKTDERIERSKAELQAESRTGVAGLGGRIDALSGDVRNLGERVAAVERRVETLDTRLWSLHLTPDPAPATTTPPATAGGK